MEAALKRVIAKFEAKVRKLNSDRSLGPHGKFTVTVLGQQGLLVRENLPQSLPLLATTDFDAWLKEDPPLDLIFVKLLHEEGLSYDEQSKYIWIPDEAKYETLYESDLIKIDSPLPIYLIVSKALKAPEKNKQLVTAAIVEYGDELLKLFEKYEVDITYFI